MMDPREGRLLICATVPVLSCALVLSLVWILQVQGRSQGTVHSDLATSLPQPGNVVQVIPVLVDDFGPLPMAGESIYHYNRLGGDRGTINDAQLGYGNGRVTMTVAASQSFGGMWTSLNHPLAEGASLDFSALLPEQIRSPLQSKVSGISIHLLGSTPESQFRIELKNGPTVIWSHGLLLDGLEQYINIPVPSLGEVTELVWLVDMASPGDFVIVDRIQLSTTTQITDKAQQAFLWSYGMLLNNWNPVSGLVRDKSRYSSGEMDAIQATGALAATSALASQLGAVSEEDAIEIVRLISNTLLLKVPRNDAGLLPHFTYQAESSDPIRILTGTEWSSIDTSIAMIGLLEAQSALGLHTGGAEAMLEGIDWQRLVLTTGLSHGFTYTNTLISHAWNTFGGETWLVSLLFAGQANHPPTISYPSPPTANGSGFIDELAWLFFPPLERDVWGSDWAKYRQIAAERQVQYFSLNYPDECFDQLEIFGLSAAEVPDYSLIVDPDDQYVPFGVGGRLPPNDGSGLFGAPAITPHYLGMIAPLRGPESASAWAWLIDQGLFTPLNNVESLMFASGWDCSDDKIVWNSLKGSWNLALQALGWGIFLAGESGQMPTLWDAAMNVPTLYEGYRTMYPRVLLPTVVSASIGAEK